jgi:hypothetical protein
MLDQISQWKWENVRIFEEFYANQTNFFGVISRPRALGICQGRVLSLQRDSELVAIALGMAGEFLLSRIEEAVT